ncbi:MAG: hypothetical protein M1818_005601 [Claussenomyces sp. TS43310]|nr:MAG: hypothetical protein M1818_005601 [Claussenomyces sp. TS43310]
MASSTAAPASVLPANAAKPIRFVNNEGRPPAKRRRINAACQTCRRRKIRCDGRKPICSTCTDNGHTCLGYPETGQSKPRYNTTEDHGSEDEQNDGNHSQSTGASQNARPRPRSYQDAIPANITISNGPGEHVTGPSSTLDQNYDKSPAFADDNRSSPSAPVHGRRVPYFRYFGPTAIVPGYKQMVVSLRDRDSNAGGPSSSLSPVSGGHGDGGDHGNELARSVRSARSARSAHSAHSGSEPPARVDLPYYDRSDPAPVNSLIRHLVEIFFTHVGCNFPFLQREKFERMVAEKKVDAILVNAVCALAARFSDHPLLTRGCDAKHPKSEFGSLYAQRAKYAVIDTFPYPTVAAVQACLLLGYESFGSDQDSALWMYTGCAIRMAVDLGLQKIDGVKGADSDDSRPDEGGKWKEPPPFNFFDDPSNNHIPDSSQRQKAVELERSDTLWAVLMLDRVISAGTGRPVSLRNEDFELPFPEVTRNAKTGWPAPFPALIQMINLYARVSDLLNNIRDATDLTEAKMAGLSSMENELTNLYHKFDRRLTFNATNFQHYVKCGEGTNFILLHFWFHTLIMLLHQPMLLHSFQGGKQQILPNSRELTMSSAKTIADILAFAELIDPKSFVGNPFTCQPMYTAACAFLMESRTTSHPGSRDLSPPRPPGRAGDANGSSIEKPGQDPKAAKQNLLAAAANQNYQRCYNGLVQLQTYWAGTKYIITALDQRAKGIWDPETYTSEEMASTRLSQTNALQDWKSKLPTSVARASPGVMGLPLHTGMDLPGSPLIDPSQAIGWSLTGTTNSPSSNLAFLYQSMGADYQAATQSSLPGNMVYDPIRQSLPENNNAVTASMLNTPALPYSMHNNMSRFPRAGHAGQASPYSHIMSSGTVPSPSASVSDAEMLLGLQQPSPYSPTPSSHPNAHPHTYTTTRLPRETVSPRQSQLSTLPSANHSVVPNSSTDTNALSLAGPAHYDFAYNGLAMTEYPYAFPPNRVDAGDMMIESQEIDMSALGGQMVPWLEFLPQDVLGLSWVDSGSGKDDWS